MWMLSFLLGAYYLIVAKSEGKAKDKTGI